jgi:NAD(P)H-flavin reductase
MTLTHEVPPGVPSPHPMLPSPFCVELIRRDTRDTTTVELTSASGGAGMPFAAGQFNMVYVFGVGEVPMSITGDPGKTDRLVHTTRSVGAVSSAIGKLKRGDFVGIRGPFGTSWPLEEAQGKDVVVVAGGIGLAPLRPALYHMRANRAKYGKVFLLYGGRTAEDLLFVKEIERWWSQSVFRIEMTVDRAPAGWHGTVGVVTTLIPKISLNPPNTIAMVCGPEIMMRFTARELERHGIRQSQTYVSMERNMKCAVGFCGHCQFGPHFICKDGPVYRADKILPLLSIREI